MLYLLTGATGDGKTLNALRYCDDDFRYYDKPKRTKYQHTQSFFSSLIKYDDAIKQRPIYYLNLELTDKGAEYFDNFIPTTPEAVKTWLETTEDSNKAGEVISKNFPKGSVILIDEADDFFPQRKASVDVPDYISQLAKHRHYGLDFVFITQTPNQLDVALRRLIKYHRHIERQAGLDSALVYQWDTFHEDYLKAKHKATKTRVSYRKLYYSFYKSSSLHTTKKKIPKWLFAIPLVIAFVVYLFFIAFNTLTGSASSVDDADPSIIPSSGPSVISPSSVASSRSVVSGLNLPWFYAQRQRIYKHLSGGGNPVYHFSVSGDAVLESTQSDASSNSFIVLRGSELALLGFKIVRVSDCIDIIIFADSRDYTTCKPYDQDAYIAHMETLAAPLSEYSDSFSTQESQEIPAQ